MLCYISNLYFSALVSSSRSPAEVGLAEFLIPGKIAFVRLIESF